MVFKAGSESKACLGNLQMFPAGIGQRAMRQLCGIVTIIIAKASWIAVSEFVYSMAVFYSALVKDNIMMRSPTPCHPKATHPVHI